MHIVDCHTHKFRFRFIHTNILDPEIQDQNCIFSLLALVFASTAIYIYSLMGNVAI